MKFLKTVAIASVFLGSISLFAMPASAATPPDMSASMAAIPGLIDPPGKGIFVDLVRAILAHTGAHADVVVLPWPRSVDSVVAGRTDFHVPAIRLPIDKNQHLPYRFMTEKIGKVSFVIYSNAQKPLTRKMLMDALHSSERYPYTIETILPAENLFEFPCLSTSDIANSLRKVQMGRVDAMVWAQEESDLVIRQQKLNGIHRELLGEYEDTFVVAANAHGDEVDKILTETIKKMRFSGELAALYEKLHRPYDNWQPSELKTAAQ